MKAIGKGVSDSGCSSLFSQKGALFIHLKGGCWSAGGSIPDSVRLHRKLYDLCTPLSISPFALFWPPHLAFLSRVFAVNTYSVSFTQNLLFHIHEYKKPSWLKYILEFHSKCCVLLKWRARCICTAELESSHRLEYEEVSSSRWMRVGTKAWPAVQEHSLDCSPPFEPGSEGLTYSRPLCSPERDTGSSECRTAKKKKKKGVQKKGTHG